MNGNGRKKQKYGVLFLAGQVDVIYVSFNKYVGGLLALPLLVWSIDKQR